MRSGAALKTFGPPFKPYAPRHFKALAGRADVGDGFQLVECVLFHFGLLSPEK
jgi:hypothetical protein